MKKKTTNDVDEKKNTQSAVDASVTESEQAREISRKQQQTATITIHVYAECSHTETLTHEQHLFSYSHLPNAIRPYTLGRAAWPP